MIRLNLGKGIQYYSTNLRAPNVSFREALLAGLAPDGGLYLPLKIPKLSKSDLEALAGQDYPDIAETILGKLTDPEIESATLRQICREIYNFSVPLEKVDGRKYILRLDQGPTASFKDFAALFMARMMHFFLSLDKKQITILTATSGDTGSAVANAFYGLDNIRVVILFPRGEVTGIQRQQMTTLKKNIRVVEIDGKFDDCQKLVKTAFMDQSLAFLSLSSANSINIGRLLPQSVYYFHAWSVLSGKTEDTVVFSVPSGNFGNLAGGIIAREMGLPVTSFVVSVNGNNEFPEYLKTGKYKPVSPSRNCISSAMNVGHPSNLARIITLYGGRMGEKGNVIKSPDTVRMRTDFFSISVDDDQTRETIRDVWNRYGVLLEPHGAVAWYGLQSFPGQSGAKAGKEQLFVSLETAHPAKFPLEIKKALSFLPSVPESLAKIDGKDEEYISLGNNYDTLKKFLINSL